MASKKMSEVNGIIQNCRVGQKIIQLQIWNLKKFDSDSGHLKITPALTPDISNSIKTCYYFT